ncbi:MAG: ketoacyl-ACP synthase III [Bacteroidia bacterium]|nr:ketoacyl-ACP synthase III [Bacteroidia bacterium]
MNIVISGTGSHTPCSLVANSAFNASVFYDVGGVALESDVSVTIERFQQITGIEERRYINNNETLSDIAAVAGIRALKSAKVDPEKIDMIIMAHNFGNVLQGSLQVDILPSVASRVKHIMGISNPDCVAFDIVFGCPGWIQAMIVARYYILSGDVKKILVIGGDTLSRVADPYDRDSMIFADGAGAAVLENRDNNHCNGILSHCSQTYSEREAFYLYSGKSNKIDQEGSGYIKMQGKKVYEFALKHVPDAMKTCFDKSGEDIRNLKKIFLHQANEKMDHAILKRFYKLYNMEAPEQATIMPMNIHKLGNTSVASIPTLLDAVLKNKYPGHQLREGDVILMASVGAGMNINALTYKL